MVAKIKNKNGEVVVEEKKPAAAAVVVDKKRKLDETQVATDVDNPEKQLERKRLKKETEKKAEKERKERTLFVKSFPGEFTEADLKKLSKDILSVKIEEKGNKNNQAVAVADENAAVDKKKKKKRVKKSAYLEFKNKEAVDENFAKLKEVKFPNGQQLLVDYVGARSTYQKEGVKKKAKGKRDMKRLHVSGIDKTADDAQVKKLFPKCSDFFMQKKRDTNTNLGFAFVQFNTEEEAKKIREATNGKDFNGKPLNVDFAIARDQAKKNRLNKKKQKQIAER